MTTACATLRERDRDGCLLRHYTCISRRWICGAGGVPSPAS